MIIKNKGEFIMKLIKIIMMLFITSFLFAESAYDIMKKANLASYYQGKDGKGQMLMKVFAKGSSKPIKKVFYMLRLNIEEGGKQMFFTYFTSPSDIKRTTFLVHKFIEKDDFRRLYMPASDKVIAIAGSRKQDPFMGSDFSYEDVSGRNIHHDDHALMEDESIDNEECYVVITTPKAEYAKGDKLSKIKAWISKNDYLPRKVEYYNKAGEVISIFTASSIKEISGFPTILKRVMESPLAGTRTELLVNPKGVAYNIGLDEGVFSERSLKNPPMKYLK